MYTYRWLVLAMLAPLLGACGSKPSTKDAISTSVSSIRRIDQLTVTCGAQVQANGAGAAPNEVVMVRVQEQTPKGIDISREVVADSKGDFVMNDYCDPESPAAEVPAIWSYRGVTSGKTGSDLIRYKLAPQAASTKPA